VVVIVFSNVFHPEMHQNVIFFIFKKLFLKSVHQNDSKQIKTYFLTKIYFLNF
jgi:hypothetical protein